MSAIGKINFSNSPECGAIGDILNFLFSKYLSPSNDPAAVKCKSGSSNTKITSLLSKCTVGQVLEILLSLILMSSNKRVLSKTELYSLFSESSNIDDQQFLTSIANWSGAALQQQTESNMTASKSPTGKHLPKVNYKSEPSSENGTLESILINLVKTFHDKYQSLYKIVRSLSEMNVLMLSGMVDNKNNNNDNNNCSSSNRQMIKKHETDFDSLYGSKYTFRHITPRSGAREILEQLGIVAQRVPEWAEHMSSYDWHRMSILSNPTNLILYIEIFMSWSAETDHLSQVIPTLIDPAGISSAEQNIIKAVALRICGKTNGLSTPAMVANIKQNSLILPSWIVRLDKLRTLNDDSFTPSWTIVGRLQSHLLHNFVQKYDEASNSQLQELVEVVKTVLNREGNRKKRDSTGAYEHINKTNNIFTCKSSDDYLDTQLETQLIDQLTQQDAIFRSQNHDDEGCFWDFNQSPNVWNSSTKDQPHNESVPFNWEWPDYGAISSEPEHPQNVCVKPENNFMNVGDAVSTYMSTFDDDEYRASSISIETNPLPHVDVTPATLDNTNHELFKTPPLYLPSTKNGGHGIEGSLNSIPGESVSFSAVFMGPSGSEEGEMTAGRDGDVGSSSAKSLEDWSNIWKEQSASYKRTADSNLEQLREVKSPRRSDVTGVYWYGSRNGWVTQWFEEGKNKHKFFSNILYGVEGAKQKAIAYRIVKLKEKYQ